jgi:hypothetical protein
MQAVYTIYARSKPRPASMQTLYASVSFLITD